MGCASSKHRKRCVHCHRGYTPMDIPRSCSMNHPQENPEDSCHMVPLSSSSLGSLKLCDSSLGHNHKHLTDYPIAEASRGEKKQIYGNVEKSNWEMQAKLMEAKVWSSMMDEKIPKVMQPKTPILTPPGEPETINTWEMMNGLEDGINSNLVRSFSNGDVKPVWHQIEEEEEGVKQSCRVEDFDPLIISSFRKSLQQLPSDHPFHIPIRNSELMNQQRSLVKERVILYFTSLRGIRKTYEESCNVRIILKSIGVRVDERDVSMHSSFKEELKELLKEKFNNGVGITLPRVFLGKKYIGGGEEIRKLNEDGKLEKVLEGCERVEEHKNGNNGHECEGCGDIRFVPCETCSGSCKVYEDEEEDEDDEEKEYGFQTCPDCNENGLVRCPLCCD